jgi:predicted dehydrogenase
VLADPKVDIVTVATPNDVHKEIVIAALEAGKNVICEKPVAMNSRELQEMIDAANRNGVLFTVHQNRRWDEDFRIVRKLYEENTLGRIFRIESRTHGSRGIPGDWRNQKQYGGGMLMDWGVHLLDQLLLLLPQKIESVYAQMTNVTNEDCDDGFTAQLKFEGDLCVEVQVSTSNFIALPRWYVLGENGTALIQNFKLEGKIVIVSDWENRDAVPVNTAAGLTKTMAPRTSDTIQVYPLPEVESDILDYYRNMAKVVRGLEKPIVTHDQVRRVFRLMEAIVKSHETGEVVRDFDIPPAQ